MNPPMERMMNNPPIEPNLRSNSYFVARAGIECRRCGRRTVVTALALAGGHEIFEADPDSAGASAGDLWQAADAGAFLFHVEQLPPNVQCRLQEVSPHYRHPDAAQGGEGAQGGCWTNHCEHCGAPLSDDDLHCEPGAPFMPQSAAEAAAIEMIICPGPFEAAAGGYAHEPDYFEFMRRA
jgi:hypothetical protein